MSSLESAPALEAAEASSLAVLAGIAFVGFLTARGVWNLFHHKGMLSGAEGKFL